MTKPRDPGLRIHHDVRNERYLKKDQLVRALGASPVVPAPFQPKTRRHRQYRYFDQGQTPKCTGYGAVTFLATADPYNNPEAFGITGDSWYDKNVAFDRAAGRFYDGGATVTAAMEVGRQLGFWDVYRWMYELVTMQQAILEKALMAGTYWYPSMFERDAEGIVRMPGPNERTDEGHLYTINGYDAKRGLWRIPNTWGDGDYFIPDELMHRLVREEGEIAQPDEIKVPAPAKLKVAA